MSIVCVCVCELEAKGYQNKIRHTNARGVGERKNKTRDISNSKLVHGEKSILKKN